jgi:Tol biopolymer transport system component
MSPEQVNGEKVDHRTDLFSMGVVLYELLTGQSPFKSDTEAATLHAITNTNPEPLARFRREVPQRLQYILDKALDKNVATRYQHADEMHADLKRALDALAHSANSQMNAIPIATRKRWPVIAAIGGVLVVFLAIAWLWRGTGDRGASPILAKQKQITFSGDIQLVDISPDGSKLAFVRREDESFQGLYTYSLAGGDPLLIFEGYMTDFAWSPDGNSILAAGVNKDTMGGVFLIPYMGGNPRLFPVGLCSPCVVSWDPGGAAFYYHESCGSPGRFLKIDVKTGDTAAYPLTMPVKWVNGMAASPDGYRLLLEVESDSGSALWTTKTDGSDARKLLDLLAWGEKRICWAPDSRAVYLIRNEYESLELVKQGIDSRTGKAQGFPQVLLSGLDFSGPISTSQLSATLAYRRRATSSALKLWSRKEANGKSEYIRDVIGTSTCASWAPRISPDGSKAAYVTALNNRGHLRILSLRDRTTRELDIAGRDIADCAWSPDGKRMAILYYERAALKICLADASTGSVFPSPESWTDLTFSAEISWAPLDIILAQVPGNRNFYKLDPRAGSVGRLITNDSLGWIFSPAPSVRGEVATAWNRYPDAGTWLISIDGTHQVGLTRLPVKDGGWPLNWSADGMQLYWREGCCVFRSSRDGTVTDTILHLGADSLAGISVSPDGKYIFAVLSESEKDVWVIENFDPEVK